MLKSEEKDVEPAAWAGREALAPVLTALKAAEIMTGKPPKLEITGFSKNC
jgi:hypothetical protein